MSGNRDASWLEKGAASLAEAFGFIKGVDGNYTNEVKKAESEMDGIALAFQNSVSLTQDAVADAKLYIQQTGTFWMQNLVMPVMDVLYGMFGFETPSEKLAKAKETLRSAEDKITGLQDQQAEDLSRARNSNVLENGQSEINTSIRASLDRAGDALPQHENRGALGRLTYNPNAQGIDAGDAQRGSSYNPQLQQGNRRAAPELNIDNF